MCKWQSSHLYNTFDPPSSHPTILAHCGWNCCTAAIKTPKKNQQQQQTSDIITRSPLRLPSRSFPRSEPCPALWFFGFMLDQTSVDLLMFVSKENPEVWMFSVASHVSVRKCSLATNTIRLKLNFLGTQSSCIITYIAQ